MVPPKRYFQEVAHQAKKVRWPDFSTFINAFVVVMVILIIAGLILMFENWTGLQLMNSLKDIFAPIASVGSTASSSVA